MHNASLCCNAAMMQESAKHLSVSLQPVVSGAAMKKSCVVGYSTRTSVKWFAKESKYPRTMREIRSTSWTVHDLMSPFCSLFFYHIYTLLPIKFIIENISIPKQN